MDSLSLLMPLIAERLQVSENRVIATPVHGGSINQCYKLQAGGERIFCKVNSSANFPDMFKDEQIGLDTIAAADSIRVPGCIGHIEQYHHQCLLLEWVDSKYPSESFWKSFGQALAELHSTKQAAAGFHSDNYIGSLRQYNQSCDSWCAFFIHQRLEVQVRLAAENKLLHGSDIDAFSRLYQQIEKLMPDEPNVLLHGDLWSGNFMSDTTGQAVIFDPAVYYGLRHVDLAMTTLFGGFDDSFYEAYRYYSPLPLDFQQIWEVLNLYPLLVHLNLFGSFYRKPIVNVLKHF
jgi:protein-ribulosamine 3-kinase